MSGHAIIIRPLGNAFRITVEPPLEGHDFTAVKSDVRGARGYSRGLRLSLDFKIVDETGEVLQ